MEKTRTLKDLHEEKMTIILIIVQFLNAFIYLFKLIELRTVRINQHISNICINVNVLGLAQ